MHARTGDENVPKVRERMNCRREEQQDGEKVPHGVTIRACGTQSSELGVTASDYAVAPATTQHDADLLVTSGRFCSRTTNASHSLPSGSTTQLLFCTA